MKNLELDLEKIKIIAEQKRQENYDFRSFLKSRDSTKVDRIVHRLNEKVSSAIDCLECGNCCEYLWPCLTKPEIKKMAEIDNIPLKDFISLFLEKDEDEGLLYLKDRPCKYLDGKSCSIYPDRPKDCRSFPHLHKEWFNSRTLGVIENYSICPIVFNVYERLKVEFQFR